jgi:hypothetical protein
LQILKNNSEAKANSFLFYLHERSVFNEDAFWEYYESLKESTRQLITTNLLDKEICILISRTYSYIMRSFIASLNNEDLYFINNLPQNKLIHFTERLHEVFNGYFQCYILDESLFDDGLINPYIIEDIKVPE